MKGVATHPGSSARLSLFPVAPAQNGLRPETRAGAP